LHGTPQRWSRIGLGVPIARTRRKTVVPAGTVTPGPGPNVFLNDGSTCMGMVRAGVGVGCVGDADPSEPHASVRAAASVTNRFVSAFIGAATLAKDADSSAEFRKRQFGSRLFSSRSRLLGAKIAVAFAAAVLGHFRV
jgi:hypothetical protein